MQRRTLIATGLTAASTIIAGCGGSTENSGSEESLEDYVVLSNHEFVYPPSVVSGLNMNVTVENIGEDTLGLITVDANVFVDDERVDSGGTNITDLPADTTETDDLALADTTRDLFDEITNYEIIVSTRDDESDELEKTYEFDDFQPPQQ